MNTIELKEDLSIKSIKGFYSELGEALKEDSEIIIDFSNIERLDLSIIQVIMAALRDVNKGKKALKLKSVPDGIRKQLQICGLLRI